jgi:hypothetical protein
VRRVIIAVVGVTVLGVPLYFSGLMDAFISRIEGHPGLPSCKSSRGRADAKKTIAKSTFIETSGLAVVAITEAKMISANAQKVDCAAMVILSSAQKGTINYSFKNDPSLGDGRYYVEASLDFLSFKPYP